MLICQCNEATAQMALRSWQMFTISRSTNTRRHFCACAVSSSRTKFDVAGLKGKKFEKHSPKYRTLEVQDSTSDFFTELGYASACRHGLDGTTTSGVSRLIFATMLVEHGRVPPYILLEGCPKNLRENDCVLRRQIVPLS